MMNVLAGIGFLIALTGIAVSGGIGIYFLVLRMSRS
jgi:hypothetical protein